MRYKKKRISNESSCWLNIVKYSYLYIYIIYICIYIYYYIHVYIYVWVFHFFKTLPFTMFAQNHPQVSHGRGPSSP